MNSGFRRFPHMGYPKMGWFLKENPNLKWMITRGAPILMENLKWMIYGYRKP
jgi:hypothetical protein